MSKASSAVERDSDTEPFAPTAFTTWYVDPLLVEAATAEVADQNRAFVAALNGDLSGLSKLPDHKRELLAWMTTPHAPARRQTFGGSETAVDWETAAVVPDDLGREAFETLGAPQGFAPETPSYAGTCPSGLAFCHGCGRCMPEHAILTVEELEEWFALEEQVEDKAAVSATDKLFTVASTIAPRHQKWLPGTWHGRIPVALPTLLVGMQGKGKSQVTCRLASDVTALGGTVLILSAEDDPATTIVPRLMAAGADLSRVRIHRIEEPLKFPKDTGRLEGVVEVSGATLIIVDPILAYLDQGSDAYRPQDVRAVLSALHAMCQKHGVTILGLMHFRKESTAEVLHMVTSSSAFTEGARSVLGLGSQPEAEGLALVHLKCNVGKEQPTLALTIEETNGIADAEGVPIVTSRIVVGGTLDLSKEDVFQPSKGGRPADERDRAVSFLNGKLSASPNRTLPLTETLNEWKRGELGNERTLRRARELLGLVTVQIGGVFYWREIDSMTV